MRVVRRVDGESTRVATVLLDHPEIAPIGEDDLPGVVVGVARQVDRSRGQGTGEEEEPGEDSGGNGFEAWDLQRNLRPWREDSGDEIVGDPVVGSLLERRTDGEKRPGSGGT